MRNRSRFGWIELIEGILLIILGIFSFLRPDSMLSGFVMFFGLIALCIGILDIIFYVRTEEHVGFAPTIALMSGCLSVLAGLMLLVYPGAVKGFFTFLPDVVYRTLHFTTVTAANDTRLDSKMALLLYYDCKHRWSFSWHFHADSPCCCTHIT